VDETNNNLTARTRAFPERSSEGFDLNGMDLRDWFAGQAMIGDLSRDGSALDLLAGRQALARKAYEIADAMLEARK
jgi:hypothetical protein